MVWIVIYLDCKLEVNYNSSQPEVLSMAQAYIVPDNHVIGEANHGLFLVQGPQGLTVGEKQLTFPAQGYTHFIGVICELPTQVGLKEEAEWVSLTQKPEGVIVICGMNTTGADREATVEIKTVPPEGAEVVTAEVKLKQLKESTLNFAVSPSIVEVDHTQQEVDLDILTCDKGYTVFSGSSWCKCSPTYGNQPVKAKLSIDENKEKVARRGQVKFRSGAKQVTVEVIQKAST